MSINKERGFGLIGVVVTIAILGILAATLIPRTLKSHFLDIQIAEVNRLANLHHALTDYVTTAHIVPGNATWATAISQFAGESPAQIVISGMNQQVIYVYPDDFIAAGNTLPYDQVANATAGTFLNTAPANARVMIISNLSQTALATASGPLVAATFDTIWNQGVGTPAELTESDTLKIERVNLAAAFHAVTLNNNDAANAASYTVNGQPAPTPATIASMTSTTLHLITATPLVLNDVAGAVFYRHTVTAPTSFVFNGVWGGTLGGSGGGGGGGGGAGGTMFDPYTGFLNNWGPNPACTPTGTAYPLTVTAGPSGDYNWFYGSGAGVMTFVVKVKKNKTQIFNIPECSLVVIVPQDPTSAAVALFYMPHNAYTSTLP